MQKKGLKEFQKVYDISCNNGGLALDLAQNLRYRLEMAKDNSVQEGDVKLAYALTSGYLMKAIHQLADALGFTGKDYIEGAEQRRGEGNVNIYVMGEGSTNCNIEDLIPKEK